MVDTVMIEASRWCGRADSAEGVKTEEGGWCIEVRELKEVEI
jgi:hypothetical protein